MNAIVCTWGTSLPMEGQRYSARCVVGCDVQRDSGRVDGYRACSTPLFSGVMAWEYLISTIGADFAVQLPEKPDPDRGRQCETTVRIEGLVKHAIVHIGRSDLSPPLSPNGLRGLITQTGARRPGRLVGCPRSRRISRRHCGVAQLLVLR